MVFKKSSLKIPSAKVVGFDTETTGLFPHLGDRPYCFSWCDLEGNASVFSFSVDKFTREVLYTDKEYQTIKTWAEDPSITKIGHNIAFDYRMLKGIGIEMQGEIICTMNLVRLLKSDEKLALKPFCEKWLGIPNEDEKELKEMTRKARAEGRKQGWKIYQDTKNSEDGTLAPDYWLAGKKYFEPYALLDACRTISIYKHFKDGIKETNAEKLWETELQTWKVLRKIEDYGIRLLRNKVLENKEDLKKKLETYQKEFFQKAGKVNPNSSKQLIELFFNRLKLPVVYTTKNNNPSTDTNTLRSLNHPIAKLILNIRACEKTIQFMDQYLKHAVQDPFSKQWFIRPAFHQAMTETSRESCIAKETPIEIVRDVSKYPKGVPIENVKPGDWAYTYDKNKKLILRKVTAVLYKGIRPVIRIHWKGKGRHHQGFLDVTPEHRIRLTTGQYVRADGLKHMDKVCAVARSTSHGYSRLHITGSLEVSDHRFVYQQLNHRKAMVVHHINHNKQDNRPGNLKATTFSKHAAYHFSTPSTERILQLKKHAKNLWKLGKFTIHKGKECGNWLGLTKQHCLYILQKNNWSTTKTSRIEQIDFDTLKKYIKMHKINLKKLQEKSGYRTFLTKKDCTRILRENNWSTNSVTKNNKIGFHTLKKYLQKYGFDIQVLKNKAAKIRRLYNHQVDYVENINQVTPVYDLSIDETENFIAGELCVHNCKDPNLQQVASGESDKGADVRVEARSVFGARNGYQLRSYDWKNIEVYIPAFKSQDSKLTTILSNKGDVHQNTADSLTNLLSKEITRYDAKRVFFGLQYGIGIKKLARTLGIEQETAEGIIYGFQKEYPDLWEWMQDLKQNIRRQGCVVTDYGRRIYVPVEQEYKGVNYYVQGTAGGILKTAKIKIHRLSQLSKSFYIVLPIHDELLIEINKKENVELLDKKIVDVMQDNPELKMPIKIPVSISAISKSWAEKTKVKTVY